MNTQKDWKLDPEIARDTQGLMRSGYSKLDHGRALFLELPENCNGSWLATLQEIVPITAAITLGGGAQEEATAAIAFTYSALKRMGLDEGALASFATPFREGMFQVDRRRRLGDQRSGVWLDTVIADGPIWSGNTEPRAPVRTVEAYSAGKSPETEDFFKTDKSVHVMLTLYSQDELALDRLIVEIDAAMKGHSVKIVHRLPLGLNKVDDHKFGREHFGFADGISQPVPFDKSGAVLQGEQAVTQAGPIHGVPLGEFLIGYENGHREFAPGPVVPGNVVGKFDPRPEDAGLPPHPEANGYFDFGKNGSYVVVRQLKQDVAAFWRCLDKAADAIRASEPNAKHIDADWLAERIVGRTKEGDVLREKGPLPPETAGVPRNDFLYFEDDRRGLGCPLGSHVRRANPRDGLAPYPGHEQTLLDAANNHRILRRGRNYGPKQADSRIEDDEERGLLFICLNTDIARQFEFTQQTWLLNSDFSTLFEEVDPLVGPDGQMTIPEAPLRRRIHVETFIKLVGGDYFFLPSMPALRYLALL